MNTLDKLQKAFPECYRKGNVLLINADCMDVMKLIDDKEFCLACVDPPYGIDWTGQTKSVNTGKSWIQHDVKNWDSKAPEPAYFDELQRISKAQIIWGANHFIDAMPFMCNAPCWIVWDKENGATDFADCELAWTSFKTAVRRFRFQWHGMLQGDMKNKELRIHPTQKPVKLYEWLLDNYAKQGDKILDTHLGSGSSAIAAHYGGFDFVGCELDTDYFNAASKRFEQATAQIAMF